MLSVICFVGDLGADQSSLLAAALERVGCTAALHKPAAGRDTVLCRFSAATGLTTLYAPSDPPHDGLDLRRWVLATRAAAAAAEAEGSSPAPANDASGALAALEALLNDDTSAWHSRMAERMAEEGGVLTCTVCCTAPSAAVDETALAAVLEAANERFWRIQFAVVAPPEKVLAALAVEHELRQTCATLTFTTAVEASDNAGYRAVPCTPAAAEELALALLIPEQRAVHASLCFPAQLIASGACRVRIALRPVVSLLCDRVELVRVCSCHGRPLLSRGALVHDCSFVKIKSENMCATSGKSLKPGEWHPNCVAVGDGVLQLPSFLSLSWLTADDAPEFSAVACVPLAGVSESQLFGMPFTVHAVDDEEEQTPTNSTNTALVEAVRAALHARDCGMLLVGTPNLADDGPQATFRSHYMAMPSAEPHGGFMLKRIVAREELMPTVPAVRAPQVPAALAAEVARSLSAMLPDTTYDAWAHERGMHELLVQAVDKSLVPPPRGSLHHEEADAIAARERASGRKASKSSKGKQ